MHLIRVETVMADNIILVTVDSLRADHCAWQSETNLTPFLEELAEDSLTYPAAISPGPRTFSSITTTHTGVPLSVTNQPIDNDDDRIKRIAAHLQKNETVAEQLQKQGYSTLAFTANPWTSADIGFDKGFDEFVEVGRQGGKIHDFFRGTPAVRAARLFDLWVHNDSWFSQWQTFYDDIVRTIESTDGPVFTWIFLLDTHNPYLVPGPERHDSSTYGMYAGLLQGNQLTKTTDGETTILDSIDEKTARRLKNAYRDCVRSVDSFVKRLVTDVGDETLLVFHSDHGEAFGEHGTYGHQSVLYEENIHVPLLIHGADENKTVDRPISTVYIPHLISKYAREETIQPMEFSDEYVFARTLDDSAIAVRGQRWKYIRTHENEELYNLERRREQRDVSAEHPDITSDLRARSEEFLSEQDVARVSNIDLSENEKMKQHLQSLGYLDGSPSQR